VARFAVGSDGRQRDPRPGFADAHGVVHAGVVGEKFSGAQGTGIGQQYGETLAGGSVAVAIAFAQGAGIGRHGATVGDLVIGERGGGGVHRNVDGAAELAIGGHDAGSGDDGVGGGESHHQGGGFARRQAAEAGAGGLELDARGGAFPDEPPGDGTGAAFVPELKSYLNRLPGGGPRRALDLEARKRHTGGADADFTLYEDEGVNYAYEKGVRSSIPIHWDDRLHRLIIGERVGSFPGMVKNRHFTVHVAGTNEQTDKRMVYTGQKRTIEFK